MDTTNLLISFLGLIGIGIALDWHCRGLSDQRRRRSLHAEVQSYLRQKERI